MNTQRIRPALHGALLLSGAGGLGLQLGWTRQLALALGHELPATLSVLTAVFSGLALGAWGFQKAETRWQFRPGWTVGIEGLVGAWALLTAVFLVPASAAALNGMPAAGSSLVQAALSFAVPLVLLLPATTALGATLPAVLRLLPPRFPGGDPVAATLYAANTGGAVLGTWGSVWWLQPHLGLRGSIAFCGGLHLIAALLLQIATGGTETPPKQGVAAGGSRRRQLAVTLALTGFLGLSLEIAATRALAPILEGTVYTQAAILGVFLLATAAGSAIEGRRSAVAPPRIGWLAVATVAAGHAVIHLREWNEGLRSTLGTGLGSVFLAESLLALAVLGAPCLLMGGLFARWVGSARDCGLGAGTAFALNTAGAAVAGPLFGAVLLPGLGLRWGILAVGAGYLLLAFFAGSGRNQVRIAALASLVLGIRLPGDLGRPPAPAGARWRDVREGRTDTVGVSETPDGNRTLTVNGRFTMGGTASTNGAARQVLLPLAWHPHPRRLLVLGLGTGISLGAAATDPEVAATGVELVPDVVALQKWFRPHNPLATGSRVVTADARRFLKTTTERYDVIVGDLFHPARDGAGALYTREQFAAMRARLAPGGLAVQWLPLYQLDLETMRSIVGAFLQVFPEAHGWMLRPNIDTPVLGLSGRDGPWNIHETDFATRTPAATFETRLQAAGAGTAEHLYGSWLAGPRALAAFAAGAAASTDDRPSVVFRAPRLTAAAAGSGGTLLADLLDRFSSEGSEFPLEGGGEWGRRLAAYRSARDEYLRGLLADDRKEPAEAEGAFLRSTRLSPDFTLGYSQLLTRAMIRSRSDPGGTRRILEGLRDARPEQRVSSQLLERLNSQAR